MLRLDGGARFFLSLSGPSTAAEPTYSSTRSSLRDSMMLSHDPLGLGPCLLCCIPSLKSASPRPPSQEGPGPPAAGGKASRVSPAPEPSDPSLNGRSPQRYGGRPMGDTRNILTPTFERKTVVGAQRIVPVYPTPPSSGYLPWVPLLCTSTAEYTEEAGAVPAR